MVLWIAMAVLAAAACVPLLVALGRASPVAPSATAQAMAIYRDQLDEVSRDVARGVVAEGDAEAARTEIARRLIRADAARAAPTNSSASGYSIAAAVVIGMPIAALGLYLVLGSPHAPDQPFASRPDAVARQQVTELVAKVEAHLATNPDDAKGWEVIAPVYERLGRDTDAAHAWSRVIELAGPTADREANLGEVLVAIANGTVTPDAVAAFEKARELAPGDARARFYLALALSQAGKTDQAIEAWQALIKDAPKDATWLPAASGQLAALETPQAGPSADDIAAAQNLAPADRRKMIEGMVASLADRLKTTPDDADGWARLVRSYMVLDRADDARAALASARTALSADSAKLAIVEATAKEVGLAETTQ